MHLKSRNEISLFLKVGSWVWPKTTRKWRQIWRKGATEGLITFKECMTGQAVVTDYRLAVACADGHVTARL